MIEPETDTVGGAFLRAIRQDPSLVATDWALLEQCQDCKAEPTRPCHMDCSSNWTEGQETQSNE